MGWLTDDGAHEGYLTPTYLNTTTSKQRRDGGQVTGWRVACDCPDGWAVDLYTRVPSPAQQDIPAGRVYATDDEAADIMYRDDITHAARGHWWANHAHQAHTLTTITTAAAAVTEAQAALDHAVQQARQAGATWQTIGHAAGITRQSAHTRWA